VNYAPIINALEAVRRGLARLFSAAARREAESEQCRWCRQQGYAHAQRFLNSGTTPEADALFGDKLQYLRAQSNGEFNTRPWEEAFDQGVREACNEWEEQYGSKP
jgi:hypothetical protein